MDFSNTSIVFLNKPHLLEKKSTDFVARCSVNYKKIRVNLFCKNIFMKKRLNLTIYLITTDFDFKNIDSFIIFCLQVSKTLLT